MDIALKKFTPICLIVNAINDNNFDLDAGYANQALKLIHQIF